MTPDAHEAALKGLGADGYPDDVLQHMRDDPMGPYTVGLPDAARRLGLAKSTVYKLFKEGKLPGGHPPPRGQRQPLDCRLRLDHNRAGCSAA